MNILACGTELYSLHWYAQNSDATMHALANLPTRLILLWWSSSYILEKERLFVPLVKVCIFTSSNIHRPHAFTFMTGQHNSDHEFEADAPAMIFDNMDLFSLIRNTLDPG